ncbi:MAG TPA: hypothetical protein EYM52_00740 [Dehalococcoidia bacterium]|nr:hypothetical protein [Dehalococcoidia bacterium]
MSEDGRFVIAWEASGIDSGGDYGVFAQRYSASDAPQNGEFHVNTEVSSNLQSTLVSIDSTGKFVIISNNVSQDHVNTWGFFGQRYSSDGLLIGGEFQVNTTALSDRVNASVTMDNQGDFVVVWSGSGIDDSDGIFCRVHD